MSKANKASETNLKRSVVEAPPPPPPAELDEVDQLAIEDSGRGTSAKQEDKFYPILSVLQGLSPQCDPESPQFMEGARPGTIWLRNYDPPLIDGKDGVEVQPVKLYVEWVEWVPREQGGGMVGRSLVRPKAAKLVDPAVNKWLMPNGNEVRETRMWVVNVFSDGAAIPFIIPCASTLNTFARQWNTVQEQQHEPNGTKSPAWRHIWKLVTKQRVNQKGKWYVLAFEHVRKVTDKNQYLAGRQLCQIVEDALVKGMQLTETLGDEAAGGEESGAM